MADGERTPQERKQQRTWVIVGLAAAAAAFLYVFWAKSHAGPTADTTTAGGVAPGYGTQLGDLIQFAPGDQGGQSGGPGGIAGGASGNQIGSVSDAGPVGPAGVPASGVTAAPSASAATNRTAGPGGVATAPMAATVRTATRAPAPAPAPAPRPAPVPTQPRQTVSTVIRSGLRAQGGTGTSVSQIIGILGMGSVSPSRVANAPVAGSVPPRNLPAGTSVNNARRLGF